MAEDSLPETKITTELQTRVRERGVRVQQRLAVLARLAGAEGEDATRCQLMELRKRIESAARAVREALS